MKARRRDRSAGVFVGRKEEMGELQGALRNARAGRGRLVLLTGEPGIGKTRVAEEFASRARRRGVEVLVGRCHEGGGAPAYWPWLQIVRAGAPPPARTVDIAAGEVSEEASLAQLLEARRKESTAPDAAPLDPQQARFHLFDATVNFLKGRAGGNPLCLLIDDLHAADKPSLLLLQFLARQMADVPLLVIGAYRDCEVTRRHPFFQTLGELAREPVSRRLALRGLHEEDVARYIELAMGAAAPKGLASAIVHKTEGNPLFLSEFVRLIVAQRRLKGAPTDGTWSLSIPDGVREVIGRRLDRLSADCYEVLAIASVIGREFGLHVLEPARRQQAPPLLDLIQEAAATRIIGEVPGAIGYYRFAHVLMREILYAELGVARRLELHRRIGEAIEGQEAAGAQTPVAQLAHHFFAAAPGGDAGKAVEYARRAAERAASLLAFEESVSQYERALQALEWKATESPEEGALLRCELLVALGRAELRAGETAKARQTFQRAAELARRWQAPEWLARTALGLGAGFAWFWGYGAGTVDDVLVSLLQEALDAVGPQDSAVRVHLLSRLAVGLYWSSRAEQRARIAPLSEEAVAMAGRLGEPSLRLQALASGCWANWRPDNLEQRLTAATEIVHLARQVCDREMTLLGHEYRIVYLLEAGETAAADRQIEEFGVLAQELGQACYQWYTPMFRATRAMMAGDFEEAERLIHRALEVGQRAASETVMQACAGHLFALRREQGRAGELEPAFRGFVRQYPQMTAWRCGLAALYMDMGEQESARMQLAHLASNDFADLRRDNMWLAAAAVLAEVCSALGDARQTGLLYDMLLPYAGANVVAGVGFFSAGSVSRYLGLLASALCRRREAGRHFEEALALDRRMAAKPFVAHTLSDYAAMLLATGGDREHALRLLGEADEIARSLHMNQLAPSIRARLEVAGEVRLRSVGTRAQSAGAARRPGVAATVLTLTPSRGGPRAAPGVVPPGGRAHAGNPPAEDEPPAAGNSFQRRGEYWSISYEGHSFLLKNAKGLYYLAELLRRPALEVHALELMAAIAAPRARTVAETPPQAMRGGGLSIEAGDAGEILDRQASAAYRRRLRELRDEIEEARRFNDLGRLEKAQREADFVARELAQAIGIGGRHRRAGAAAERARMSVTRSIRLVLRKIGEHDPALGSHLASTVKTGTFCSYRPDTRVPISWRL